MTGSDLLFEQISGVLGRIVRKRVADYEGANPDLGTKRTRSYRFQRALAAGGLKLIAEIKQASPSQGAIAQLDPVAAAQEYVAGGAAALSVLTEARHFGGHLDHLSEVVKHVTNPVLRKDFIVHPAMLKEAADLGASAALLMVSVLGKATKTYIDHAHHVGLDALVEVHNEHELELALAAGAEIIGVNNRDLTTLEIDLTVSPRLIKQAKEAGFTGLPVAESGYRTREDIKSIKGLADAVLIGTSLVDSGNLKQATLNLTSSLITKTI